MTYSGIFINFLIVNYSAWLIPLDLLGSYKIITHDFNKLIFFFGQVCYTDKEYVLVTAHITLHITFDFNLYLNVFIYYSLLLLLWLLYI